MGLLFISSTLTSLRVFIVVLCGELCFRMFANADVVISVVYFCVYVCVCVCVSWLCPLEFPENPDSTHLIATHHIVTLSPRYGTHSAHQALPFPFTLPSSLLLSTFFCCSIRTFFFFFFVAGCILLEQLS